MTQEQTTNPISNGTHKLSIQVSLNGFSFCIYDTSTPTAITMDHYEFPEEQHPKNIVQKLGEYVRGNPLLQKSFKKIILIHDNELSAFVPRSLFSDKYLPEYLKFNVKLLENDYVAYDTIKHHGLVNVYIPYMNVNNFLFDYFGTFEYYHFSSILIRTLLDKVDEKKEIPLFVHVQKKYISIVAIENRKLIFYNTFSYSSKTDFMYYILFTAEQLALDPEEFPLYFLGDITEDTTLYDMAYTHIKNVFLGANHFKLIAEENKTLSQWHQKFVLLNSF